MPCGRDFRDMRSPETITMEVESMHEYDVTLKVLLRASPEMALRALTDVAVEKLVDIELPKIQNPRVDLLGESADGSLVHLELQSSNDSDMPQRMAEYALGVRRM